jgi:hypothetical protein
MIKGGKGSKKKPKGANRSQQLSMVDKWSPREAFENIRSHMEPEGAMVKHREPMGATGTYASNREPYGAKVSYIKP